MTSAKAEGERGGRAKKISQKKKKKSQKKTSQRKSRRRIIRVPRYMLSADLTQDVPTFSTRTKGKSCCDEASSRLLDRLAPILAKVQEATARARKNDIGLQNAVTAFEDLLADSRKMGRSI